MKQQFKAESQRLLDLMINSIYTHREIFLREIISNASDAIDKLAYTALTDDKVGISRDQFAITITRDEEMRTLTVSVWYRQEGIYLPYHIFRFPLRYVKAQTLWIRVFADIPHKRIGYNPILRR